MICLSLIREICCKQHRIQMLFGMLLYFTGDAQSQAFQLFSKNIQRGFWLTLPTCQTSWAASFLNASATIQHHPMTELSFMNCILIGFNYCQLTEEMTIKCGQTLTEKNRVGTIPIEELAYLRHKKFYKPHFLILQIVS